MPDPEHRGTRDATGRMARPVVVPWTCHQSGDCCRLPPLIAMTMMERQLLESRVTSAQRPLVWADKDKKDTQELICRPCPFISDQNLCLVYDIRPYVCRRFMCGRVDITKESFESNEDDGCTNLSDRLLTSRRFLEFFKSRERAAAKDWAIPHGWRATKPREREP